MGCISSVPVDPSTDNKNSPGGGGGGDSPAPSAPGPALGPSGGSGSGDGVKKRSASNSNGNNHDGDGGKNSRPNPQGGGGGSSTTSSSLLSRGGGGGGGGGALGAGVPTSTRPRLPSEMSTLVSDQWEYLWNTHYDAICDPADVPSVLDTLMNRHVDKLSATQMTFIQRKVRTTLKAMNHEGNNHNNNHSNSSNNNGGSAGGAGGGGNGSGAGAGGSGGDRGGVNGDKGGIGTGGGGLKANTTVKIMKSVFAGGGNSNNSNNNNTSSSTSSTSSSASMPNLTNNSAMTNKNSNGGSFHHYRHDNITGMITTTTTQQQQPQTTTPHFIPAPAAETEARNVAEKHHLLTETVLWTILPRLNPITVVTTTTTTTPSAAMQLTTTAAATPPRAASPSPGGGGGGGNASPSTTPPRPPRLLLPPSSSSTTTDIVLADNENINNNSVVNAIVPPSSTRNHRQHPPPHNYDRPPLPLPPSTTSSPSGGGTSGATTKVAPTAKTTTTSSSSAAGTPSSSSQAPPPPPAPAIATATTTETRTVSVIPQAIRLMMYLTPSEQLWNRVAGVARSAAEAAGLDMDVNHTVKPPPPSSKTTSSSADGASKGGGGTNKSSSSAKPLPLLPPHLAEPLPYQVEDLLEAPSLSPGISLTAFSCLLSMAVRGSRNQKLQLLFYLCMDIDSLTKFLDRHPAGGVPVWLLEVEHDVVISMASLTHYHYYGHAFLPCNSSSSVGVDEEHDVDDDDDIACNIEYDDDKEDNGKLSEQGNGVVGTTTPARKAGATTTSSSNKKKTRVTRSNTKKKKKATTLLKKRPFASSSSRREPVRVVSGTVLDVVRAALGPSNNQAIADPSTYNSNKIKNVDATMTSNGGVSLSDPHHYGASSVASTTSTSSSSNNHHHHHQSSVTQSPMSSRRNVLPGKKKWVGLNGSNHHNDDGAKHHNNNEGGGTSHPSSGDDHDLCGGWHGYSNRETIVMRRLREIADTCQEPVVDWGDLDESRNRLEHVTTTFTALTTTATPALDSTTNGNNNSTGSSMLTRSTTWTMDDFVSWSDAALDDRTLDAVMHRLLATGILPGPALERDLVQQRWSHWQRCYASSMMSIASTTTATRNGNEEDEDPSGGGSTFDVLAESVKALLENTCPVDPDGTTSGNGSNRRKTGNVRLGIVWGGLGGIDGGGGLGRGVMYCVDRVWWDTWASYVGWTFAGPTNEDYDQDDDRSHRSLSGRRRLPTKATIERPPALSNEGLLDRDPDTITNGGLLGSYEVMKVGLKRGVDYVLVPPCVWDVLYESYGGGPPLPRMVQSASSNTSRRRKQNSSDSLSNHKGTAGVERGERIDDGADSKKDMDGHGRPGFLSLSSVLTVETHPMIIQCQLCDPLQPYRRGDAGTMSIRLMTTPDQPLWRLYVEAIVRLPLHMYKAFDSQGKGKARLWKKTERTGPKDPVSRYGPWNLLCKSRHAVLPMMTSVSDIDAIFNDSIDSWKDYTDNATVEGSGLGDLSQLMLEFAVQNKNGDLMWPREAAAKAGRVRRLAEEDMKFRQLLQGVDQAGNLLLKPPNLVGMEVDAMDSTGRWYPVTIREVEIVDEDGDGPYDEGDDGNNGSSNSNLSNNGKKADPTPVTRKQVKVDFAEHGGHAEWIDVDSDRLAKSGRFTSEAEQQNSSSRLNSSSGGTTSDANKTKSAVTAKKSNADNTHESTKICVLPGYGACGLTNLGNTCYMNSALQCISFLPLLRSYLLSAQYHRTGDLNKDNPLGTKGRLLEEAAELLRFMWSSKAGERSPTKFRTHLGKINSQFSGADQQDAQEFLNYMLDVLHEDSNRVRTKPYVPALEDDWVMDTSLARVGEEAWRRFLRRNRSIMSDVAMGQVLNTVTCPTCGFSSRNFDPFNLLSIPIPTVAHVVFKCTIIRRSTAINCPWILNKSRKGDKRSARFAITYATAAPPSVQNVAEQYVIAMSRLADSGDLRLQIQNISGIPSNRLKLCRSEELLISKDSDDRSTLNRITKVSPLADKDGPCSSLARKRGANEIAPGPTNIIAFEYTLHPRVDKRDKKAEELDETTDEEEDDDDVFDEDRLLPTPRERADVERILSLYGNDDECRVCDTNPLLIAKAVSRSLWPRTEGELKLGLRVDAKDHRGNWYQGSVVEILEENNPSEAEKGEKAFRKVRVHFDNFASKWDEVYTIEHFEEGRMRPVYSHSTPKTKPVEFPVHHRYTDRETGQSFVFGQSFYIQCHNDWSNARAGAHILAQASRFLQQNLEWTNKMENGDGSENKFQRLYDKTHGAISDLIDLLIDCDREYARLALGLSDHNNELERSQPFRNPSFHATSLSSALMKKVNALLHRIPFEIRICLVDQSHAPNAHSEEVPYPFSLIRTIGNYIHVRNGVILHWREPPSDKKSTPSPNGYARSQILYVEPMVQIHKPSAEILKNSPVAKAAENGKKNRPGSAGLDLGVCLTEFCKVQKLSLSDNWRCPRCKDYREGQQNMNLWRLPDLLTFHIKRFNMSARWREKITTKVNFPLTGLNMSEWCHKESPMIQEQTEDSHVYDLIGVMNHYGSLTGGHYVATCKATVCSKDGREEVAYGFNGVGTNVVETEESASPTGRWPLGRAKAETTNQGKVAAALSSKAVSESAEPMWLQFDDELVEPIPPDHVISEMAYVLFYRRRKLTPSNIARYSTLE